jgi:hypothetical protein
MSLAARYGAGAGGASAGGAAGFAASESAGGLRLRLAGLGAGASPVGAADFESVLDAGPGFGAES